MWILIDEFNTSCHQSLIAEIMIERKSSYSAKLSGGIPDNIIFIGCCNPFRIDMSNRSTDREQEVGLVVDSDQNKLSHTVYPIADSLLSFIYDFGQLSKEDERKYIVSIINSYQRLKMSDEEQDY